jgi:hypothetical protein
MEYARTSLVARIPITTAHLNATVLAHVYQQVMVRRAQRLRNARAAIASTVIVATPCVPARAWRVRRRKKEWVAMGNVA